MITLTYAFGAALQSEATRFIQAAGGKVVGSVKHPLGTTDFSSFLLQAQALHFAAPVVGARADLALGVDHPLPGHIVGRGGHGVAHHARRAVAHDLGDLAVGRHLPAGNLAHNGIDARVQAFVFGRQNRHRTSQLSVAHHRRPMISIRSLPPATSRRTLSLSAPPSAA